MKHQDLMDSSPNGSYFITKDSSIDNASLPFRQELSSFYVHSNSPLSYSIKEEQSVCLIGHIFHQDYPLYNNQQVLDFIISSNDFEGFIDEIEKCTGRYVLIFNQDNELRFLTDACAHAELFYNSDLTFVASSLVLFEKHARPQRWQGENERLYQTINAGNRLTIGTTTMFSNVHRLLPNHFIGTENKIASRFFPTSRHPVSRENLQSAVEKLAPILKGVAASLHKRESIVLPLTAGYDSRLLLAAFKDLPVKTMIYQHPGMKKTFYDIRIAKKLAKVTGRYLNIIQYDNKILDKDREAAALLSDIVRPAQLTTLLNAVKPHFENDFVMTGIAGEIGRSYYPTLHETDLRLPKKLSHFIGHPQSPLAESEMKLWIQGIDYESLGPDNLVDLFYWEHRMGIWGAKAMTESALVTNPICPMNSRNILKLFLSVPKRHRTYYRNDLFKSLIEKLDNRILHLPINPNSKSFIIKSMVFLGIYERYRKHFLKYKMRSKE